MTDPITAAEKLKCIERELKYRKRVYPRQVALEHMTQKSADRQIAVMEAIRDDYMTLVNQMELPLWPGESQHPS